MEGTATGVLGKLPNFRRPKTKVDAAVNTARPQNIISIKHDRSFFNTLFRKARRAQTHSTFEFEFPAPVTGSAVKDILFDESINSANTGHGTKLGLLFIVEYEAPTLRNALPTRSTNGNGATVRVKHK